MSDQAFIESNSNAITQILMEVQERTIAELYALQGNQSAEEFIRLIENLDIKAIVQAKSANAVGLFTSSHTGMLESIEGFAALSEDTLQALINYNTETLLSQLDNMAQIIKKEVVKGIISGTGIQSVVESVRGQGALSSAQLQTLINTAMNEYSRSVTKVMMDKMPKQTKYVYIGAIDDVTRDDCLDMAAAGALTEAEIINRFGDAVLVDGGGFNCRHKWEISVQDKFGHDPKGAKELLDVKKG